MQLVSTFGRGRSAPRRSMTPFRDGIQIECAYDRSRPVSADALAGLTTPRDILDVEVVWFTGVSEKSAFGEITIRATEGHHRGCAAVG